MTFMTWRPKHLIEGRLDNRTPGKVTGWLRFYHRFRPWRERSTWITLDLEGDFHEDIRGMTLWLLPQDFAGEKEACEPEWCREGFDTLQRGVVGDITAGSPLGRWNEEISRAVCNLQELRWDKLGIFGSEREARRREMAAAHRRHIAAKDRFYASTPFPYVEWFSDEVGRVVLDIESIEIDVHPGWRTLKRRRVKTAADLFADEERRAAAFSSFVLGGSLVGAAHDGCAVTNRQ
jgi:hypothetical protein